MYGTTTAGGASDAGVVYKIDPAGNETVLYSFTGGADGASPFAGVILDAAGNLYGTTDGGGAAGAGVVYKLDPTGHETVLYGFMGGADGSGPNGGVIFDSAGNLYGTTSDPSRRGPNIARPAVVEIIASIIQRISNSVHTRLGPRAATSKVKVARWTPIAMRLEFFTIPLLFML